jgi:Neuraminidase (sialidase)
MNLMSVSLLRLRNGEIMLVYGRRHSNAKMWFYARFSSDEGKTWSGDSLVTTRPAYQAINNARVIQLSTGRLLAPAAVCRGRTWKDDYFFFDVAYYSDDNGRTWQGGHQDLTVPGCSFGADEPAVIELRDGRVMMLIRTDTGKIWRSFSADGGVTWSAPEPTELKSPSSPATIRRIPSTGDLLLVWNNAAPMASNAGEPRDPLTTAISRDEGKTWTHVKNLEDSAGADYCYTSVTFVGDRAVLSYYERGGLKMCTADVKWFYE